MVSILRWVRTFGLRMETGVIQASKGLNIVAPIGAAMLMLLITADVVGRFFFDHPIPGTLYISEYVLVSAVYCGVAYCAVLKGHVTIDLLVSRLPGKVRAIIDSFTYLVSLAVFSILVWSAVMMALYSKTTGEVSLDQLRLPAWPSRTIVVIGTALLCLVLLTQIVHLIAKGVKK